MSGSATVERNHRGSWRQLGWALAGFLFLPAIPIVRSIVPIEQTLLLFIPVMAVCSIVGWRLGGRGALAVVWLALAAWMLLQSAGPPGAPYDKMARGWTLLLAASFGIVSLWSISTAFFVRALAAVGLAAATGFAIALSSPGGIARVEHAAGQEFTRRSGESIARLAEVSQTDEWRSITARLPAMDEVTEETESQLRAVPKHSAALLPALLALQSIGVLALGWGLYHKLSPVRIGPPLSPLKEFRFNDQLVWGLAVGATIVLLPAFEEGKTAGLNLLLFFGALYLLRGFGVMAWMSRRALLFIVIFALIPLGLPLLGALAIGVGLGDTWLDLRRRARAS
ncbi:MAG: DUF2232 domain-containing protein [Gemmatimonadaceae bacterium]